MMKNMTSAILRVSELGNKVYADIILKSEEQVRLGYASFVLSHPQGSLIDPELFEIAEQFEPRPTKPPIYKPTALVQVSALRKTILGITYEGRGEASFIPDKVHLASIRFTKVKDYQLNWDLTNSGLVTPEFETIQTTWIEH